MSSQLKPIKGIPCFCYSIFDLQHFLWFFLKIPISLLTLPICFCLQFILSIWALSILIIVVNSWSDKSSILGMSSSDACSVSSRCGFCLLVCLVIFFLIVGHVLLSKKSCYKSALIMWWGGMGREVFCSLMIRSSLLESLCLWNVNFTNTLQGFFLSFFLTPLPWYLS